MTTCAQTVTRTDPESRPPRRRRWRWAVWTRRVPWWAEIGIAAGFYELYNVVQAATQSDADEARAHSLDIMHIEQHLRIWVEPAVNHWTTRHAWLALAAGWDYALAHVIITGSVLAYLWWRHGDVQVRLRNALVVMSGAALIVYWQFPVAPPRLAVAGFTDTVVSNDILGAAHVHRGLVNLYAAMPSLHVAWACWCAGGLTLALRSRWRYLAWLYPVTTTLVVISTANHYFLDAGAGLALAALPLAIVTARSRKSAGSPASSPIARPIPSQLR
jgi:PAP2 superfamily